MIRYLAIKDQSIYYGVDPKNEDFSVVFSYRHPLCEEEDMPRCDLESIGAIDIFPPDADPIEEFYINATDRPSRDGFKYPELHPVNDVEY